MLGATHLHISQFTKPIYNKEARAETQRFQSEPLASIHPNTFTTDCICTHTYTHTLTYTHRFTFTGAGARGSAAARFPGSLTGLMEALCLKPGQTAADSRGDAYQLLAMLWPEGGRERMRERERKWEGERKEERRNETRLIYNQHRGENRKEYMKPRDTAPRTPHQKKIGWHVEVCIRLRQLTGTKHFLYMSDFDISAFFFP